MKNCKTCKYFDTAQGWDSEEEGGCKRLGNNDILFADVWFRRFIVFHKDHNPAYVHVGSEFGCILHENKEINNINEE
jgi:hypothetical protein